MAERSEAMGERSKVGAGEKKAKARAPKRLHAAAKEVLNPKDLRDPRLYLDRELSLLAFQRRVLEEAEDHANPLLERVKIPLYSQFKP